MFAASSAESSSSDGWRKIPKALKMPEKANEKGTLVTSPDFINHPLNAA